MAASSRLADTSCWLWETMPRSRSARVPNSSACKIVAFGKPPRPDVLDFYAAADVYVSPSREDSFGLPVAEAMACGLPAITSSFAGVADYIHDGVDGFVLREPRDSQSLAELIKRLQTEPELRQRVGEVGRQDDLGLELGSQCCRMWELLEKRECAYPAKGR